MYITVKLDPWIAMGIDSARSRVHGAGVTALDRDQSDDLPRHYTPSVAFPAGMTVVAVVALMVVLLKMTLGPGVHPRMHQAVMQWGMVGFSVLSIVAALWQARWLRVPAPGEASSRFWWAWSSAAAAALAILWIAVQVVNNPIGPLYCVVDSDASVCSTHPVQLSIASGIAVLGAMLAIALAVTAVLAFRRNRSGAALVVAPAAVIGSLLAVGVAGVLIGFTLSTAADFAFNVEPWALFAVVCVVAVIEIAIISRLTRSE